MIHKYDMYSGQTSTFKLTLLLSVVQRFVALANALIRSPQRLVVLITNSTIYRMKSSK